MYYSYRYLWIGVSVIVFSTMYHLDRYLCISQLLSSVQIITVITYITNVLINITNLKWCVLYNYSVMYNMFNIRKLQCITQHNYQTVLRTSQTNCQLCLHIFMMIKFLCKRKKVVHKSYSPLL